MSTVAPGYALQEKYPDNQFVVTLWYKERSEDSSTVVLTDKRVKIETKEELENGLAWYRDLDVFLHERLLAKRALQRTVH